jgi:hypothetical protein
VSTPPRERVRWSRVAGITVVLCAVTGAATQLAHVDAAGLGGVLEPAHQLVRRGVGLGARGTASAARASPRTRAGRRAAAAPRGHEGARGAAEHRGGSRGRGQGRARARCSGKRPRPRTARRSSSIRRTTRTSWGSGIAAEHLLESGEGGAGRRRRGAHSVERRRVGPSGPLGGPHRAKSGAARPSVHPVGHHAGVALDQGRSEQALLRLGVLSPRRARSPCRSRARSRIPWSPSRSSRRRRSRSGGSGRARSMGSVALTFTGPPSRVNGCSSAWL